MKYTVDTLHCGIERTRFQNVTLNDFHREPIKSLRFGWVSHQCTNGSSAPGQLANYMTTHKSIGTDNESSSQ
jgi:hypothetical protein